MRIKFKSVSIISLILQLSYKWLLPLDFKKNMWYINIKQANKGLKGSPQVTGWGCHSPYRGVGAALCSKV
jgi:hypothetical protein